MKRMETKIIILMILGSLLLVGATYRVSLSNYHEECYQFEKVPVIANRTINKWNPCCFDTSWNYGRFCKCENTNETIYYNTTKNGECLKYILVRDVKTAHNQT